MKTNSLFFLLFGILFSGFRPALAQDAAYSAWLINQLQPSASPAMAFGARRYSPSGHCITPLLMEADRHAALLTEGAQAALDSFKSRPALSGEFLYKTAHFCFHYTSTGGSAISPADTNGNLVPDYAERMADIFETIYVQYQTLGYTMPPEDGEEGGDGLYDVYIKALTQAFYGYAAPESTWGDNPRSTTIVETTASASWMVMHNNYSWSKFSSDSIIQVTAAHEFFHAIQTGMTRTTTSFLREATATWAEDELCPGVDDNFTYLPALFEHPDAALNLRRSESPSHQLHEYGAWIFFRYLSERTSPDIIRRIYLRCITTTNEITALDAELTASGFSGLKGTFANFWLANALLTSAAPYAPYTYTRAGDYAARTGTRAEAELAYTGTAFSHNSLTDGNGTLMRLGADYFPVTATGNFKVTLTLSGKQNVTFLLLKKDSRRDTMALATPVMVNGTVEITVDDALLYDSFHLLVLRDDRAQKDTLSAQYTLNLSPRPATGTEDLNQALVRVFPNPASETLRIEAATGRVVEAVMTDLNGKELLTTGNAVMDLSACAAGMYLVRVTTTEGTVVQRVEVLR